MESVRSLVVSIVFLTMSAILVESLSNMSMNLTTIHKDAKTSNRVIAWLTRLEAYLDKQLISNTTSTIFPINGSHAQDLEKVNAWYGSRFDELPSGSLDLNYSLQSMVKDQLKLRNAKYARLLTRELTMLCAAKHTVCRNEIRVAILVCVTSRETTTDSTNGIKSISLLQHLLPSLKLGSQKTQADEMQLYLILYIGFDTGDVFYDSLKTRMTISSIILQNYGTYIQDVVWHRLPKAPLTSLWNSVFQRAYDDTSSDYFLWIGDDVVVDTAGWLHELVQRLAQNGNIGVIGPQASHEELWYSEQGLVSRTHYQIFGALFDPSFPNLHCDEWLYGAYANLAQVVPGIRAGNLQRSRYTAQRVNTNTLRQRIQRARDRICSWLLSRTDDEDREDGLNQWYLAAGNVIPSKNSDVVTKAIDACRGTRSGQFLRETRALISCAFKCLIRWLIFNPDQ